MSSSHPISREAAGPIVRALFSRLVPACHRDAIAGSYRRLEKIIHDIEIVCIPKTLEGWEDPAAQTLFPVPETVNAVWELFERLREEGKVTPVWRGEPDSRWRDKRGMVNGEPDSRLFRLDVTLHPRVTIEIYMTTPKQWGCILAIRTGSVNFSRGMVTYAKKLGMKFSGGRLWKDGEALNTPEERDVFDALGRPFVNPEDRKEWE